MVEQIILISPKEEEVVIFQMLFEQMGIKLHLLEKEDFQKPLGEFLGIELEEGEDKLVAAKKVPPVPEDKEDIEESIFVFVGFTRQRLQAFLQIMKEVEAPVVPLKAMLTKINRYWTPMELYMEIAEERDYFLKYQTKKPEED